ncbi:hypothetical protein BGZ94_001595, partial [Podila epigama]
METYSRHRYFNIITFLGYIVLDLVGSCHEYLANPDSGFWTMMLADMVAICIFITYCLHKVASVSSLTLRTTMTINAGCESIYSKVMVHVLNLCFSVAFIRDKFIPSHDTVKTPGISMSMGVGKSMAIGRDKHLRRENLHDLKQHI